MRAPTPSGSAARLSRSALLALAIAGAVSARPPRVAADPLPADPVERFRQALLEEKELPPGTSDPEGLAAALKYRQDRLESEAKNLRSLSDLSRALVLHEWQSEKSRADDVVRGEIVGRFLDGVRTAARNREPDLRASAANLVGETATKARQSFVAPALRDRIGELAPDLVRLCGDPKAEVRQAAARALGSVEADPRQSAAALRKLLSDPNPITRRSAAEAVTELLPSTEPVRSRGEPSRGDPLAVALAVFPVAIDGLGPAQPVEVRRISADSCRKVSFLLYDNLENYGSGMSSARDLPPDSDAREISPAEAQKIRDAHDRVAAQRRRLEPLFEAFAGRAPILSRASLDPDPAVRISVRRVFEDLGQANDSLERQARALPRIRPATALPKERDDADKPAPTDKPAPDETAPKPSTPKGPGDKKGAPEKSTPVPDKTPPPGKLLSGTGAAPKKARAQPPAVLPVVLASGQDDPKPEPRAGDDRRYDALQRTLKSTLDALVVGLSDPNVRGRLAALDALERMGPLAEQAIPALVDKLSDADRMVRWSAIRILGRMAPRSPGIVVPGLTRSIRNPDLDIRLATATALERYGPDARDAVVPLGLQVSQGDPEVRIAIMRALVAIGTDAVPALPAVALNLTSDTARVRSAAADTLGRFGRLAAPVATPLRRLLEDPDPDVRRAASEALLRIGGD